MSSRIRFLLPLAGLWLIPPAFATDLAYVKCAVNQDRVWVYESLNSFDVEARLRCGEPVEILHRVKGYVKIRTESGVEGYVPESAFPDLPALPDESDKPVANAAPRSVAVAAPKPAPAAEARAAPVAVAPQPSAAPSAPAPAPQPNEISAPAKPAPPAPVPAKVSTASAQAKPAPAVAKNVNAAPSNSATPPSARTAVSPSNSAAAPAKASVETVSTTRKDSSAIVSATAQPGAPAEESEEYPETQPQNESADPACRLYFAAYGLTPSQFKWLAENRRKEFAGICPALDLARVDYVILFTHDSDSYTYAMPTPVHTDRNGFSDFSPLTTVDTALIPASEVEKARYEFVWVFRMKRGDFDPAKFSPRRRPQFTTCVKGSRAPSRAIEDAFNFVETQGANR